MDVNYQVKCRLHICVPWLVLPGHTRNLARLHVAANQSKFTVKSSCSHVMNDIIVISHCLQWFRVRKCYLFKVNVLYGDYFPVRTWYS